MEMIGSIENGKRKRGESHDDDRDRISELPDEILISIISKLTLREAIATRILSTRWRYLFTKEYASHLNFPRFDFSNCDRMAMRRRFGNCINMINQIVDSHKAPKLKEFSVNMIGFKGASLEKWLVFALSKHVEIMDIHMECLTNFVAYSFQLRNLIMQLPLGLRSLKRLSLSAIYVEGSEIELLLSNSPQLESLSIASPRRLTRVSVVGQPTFMLKHLQICHAPDFKLLEIGNMLNLASLKLHKLATTFVLALNNVPKLVEISISNDNALTFTTLFSRVAPSICSQFHTLKVCSNPEGMYPIMIGRVTHHIFKSVKHLELQNEPSVNTIWLWRYLEVIRRCPSLEELVIKLSWKVNANIQQKNETNVRWARKGDEFPSLKRMKFSGFCGNIAELILVISIVNNAKSLEEVTVEVCGITEEIRLLATARALQHIKPAVEDYTRLQVI